MRLVSVLLVAGMLVLGGSAVRAGEDVPIPGTLNLAPLMPVAAESCCAPAACATGNRCCAGHWGRFCDWLMYKPPSCHACCCVVSSCTLPPYVYFLDMCQGCGRGGCGHGCATPGSNGGACEQLGFPQVESIPQP